MLRVIALGGLLWIVKPELFTPSSSETSAGEERPDTRFADLYKRYAMAPLGASVAASYDVGQALAILQKEPCNRQIAYKASTSLQEVHATRAAAEMLRGFSTACADGNNELYQASELFLVLGDLDTAIRTSSDVIRRQPDGQNAYYVRARAEQGLGQYTAAIEDYVTLLQVMPKLRSVRSEVFTRMSDTGEEVRPSVRGDQPIQIYMALNPEQRTLLPLEHRITELAAKGKCAAHYATGTARIVRLSAGVLIAKAEINGVSGTFPARYRRELRHALALVCGLRQAGRDQDRPGRTADDANGRSSAATGNHRHVAKLSGRRGGGCAGDRDGQGSSAPASTACSALSFLSRFTVVMEERPG